jgi:hypothetical protein
MLNTLTLIRSGLIEILVMKFGRIRKMKLFKKKPLPIPRNCPFCGGKPKISRCGDQRDLWYVRCTECCETPIDWGEAKVNDEYNIILKW